MFGHVDLVASDVIIGWVANLTLPERLEQVVVHGPGGDTLQFRACFPRTDVCAALSLRGRFGFAIPTSAVRHLGPVLRITDVGGVTLTGGESIALAPPEEAPEPDPPTWVVLHIQKTAGTSLRHALSQSLRPGQALFVYDDSAVGVSPSELGTLPMAQRSWLRLVMGHAYHGVADSLPGRVEHATFVRDPAARLRSQFHHHLREGTAFRIDRATLPTRLVAQHALTEEFDNFTTRVVTGIDPRGVPARGINERHVDMAIDRVRTGFRFVGLVERLDEHYATLCGLMGIPAVPLPVINAHPAPAALDPADDVDWEEALHHNRFDALLYQRLRDEGFCGRDLAVSRPEATAATAR